MTTAKVVLLQRWVPREKMHPDTCALSVGGVTSLHTWTKARWGCTCLGTVNSGSVSRSRWSRRWPPPFWPAAWRLLPAVLLLNPGEPVMGLVDLSWRYLQLIGIWGQDYGIGQGLCLNLDLCV